MSKVIVGSILIGTLLFVVPIYIRLLYHIPYIIAGSLIPIIFILVAGSNIRLQKFNKKEYNCSRIRKFAFFKSENWVQNLDITKNDLNTDNDKQIYPENFIINDTLNNIVSLILRDFVDSWFIKISTDSSFNVSLRYEFTYIIKIIHTRLSEVDFSNLLVHNVTPILNDHIDNFLNAQEITKNTKVTTTDKVIDINDDAILASNYNRGNLHSGIKLNSENPTKELSTYFTLIIDKVLPFILEETEFESGPVHILIRELLICCVLNPVCMMLSDPDFYNQIIESNLSKQMKDRSNVKKLRNVLRRHSMTFNNNNMMINSVDSDILQYKLSVDTSKKDYEKILHILESTTDIRSLLKYEYYTLLRNEKLKMSNTKSQIEESKVLQKYIKRSNTIIDTINTKLSILRGEDQYKSTEIEIKYPEFSPSALINKNLSLHEMFSSQIRLKHFTEYMQQRGDRYAILDFWLSAESLRNPLEYNNIQTKTLINNINTSDDDEESSDDEATMFIDNQLTQADDIKNIFNKYFNLQVMKIPPKIFYKVSEFIEGNCSSTLAYYRARKSILKLQDFEYMRMKKSDFVAFKASDAWLKLLVEETLNEAGIKSSDKSTSNILSLENTAKTKDQTVDINDESQTQLNKVSGDPLARYSEKESKSNYVDVNMTGKVSDKVVRAVEDALNEIMKDTTKTDVDITSNVDKRNSRLVSDDIARDLFGSDQQSLFSDKDNIDVEHNSDSKDGHLTSSVPTDTVDEMPMETDNFSVTSNSSDDPMEKNDFKVVAPSVLNLSNEIERLDVEIDRLQEQRLILKALLQKAEVVNNLPELRILKKSLISLEKELKFKSMQKEQYIVQEGENSLYQRAKVTIASYITAKDKNGKNFIMYVIKVTTLSRTDPNKITANWMVTRRFSQFYELHHYLKSKYPFVGTVDFPKKKLMVKFIQGTLIEERQKKLKIYLQSLVKNKDVCSDKIFRDFLSSETFDATLDDKLQLVNEKNKNVDGSGTKLYNIISSQTLYPLLSLANYKGNSTDQIEDKPKDRFNSISIPISVPPEDVSILNSDVDNDEYLGTDDSFTVDEETISTSETRAKDISFIKPICDLIISVFQLNNSTSWLRGRALILLFQQLFGSTVEKVLRTNIDGKIKQEDNVSKILTGLQSLLWPDGNFRKKKVPRTDIEKERTKEHTRILLKAFLTDTTSKIFGQNAANRASDTLYFVFQNEILNRHIVLSILDEVFNTLFPEINQ